jgi:hypothetical protein
MPDSIAGIMPGGTVFLPISGGAIPLYSGLAWSPSAMSPALSAALGVALEVLPTPPS